MVANVKLWITFVALLCIIVGSMTTKASAVTVEVARKCNTLANKAFPPRVPGNPAAGSAKGSGADQQAYYKKCVANGGKVDKSSNKPN